MSLQIDLAVIDGFCGRLLGQEWWHWPSAWVVECFFGWLLGFVAMVVRFCVKISRYLSGGWVFVRVVAIGFGVFIFIIFNFNG